MSDDDKPIMGRIELPEVRFIQSGDNLHNIETQQSIEQRVWNEALEKAADLCDQHLDQFSGTECTYRCDVAQAIRTLKIAGPSIAAKDSP